MKNWVAAVFSVMLVGLSPVFACELHAAQSSSQAYKAGMEKMHKGMDIAYSGDTDIDFVRGMIPHHQGAVDMAKVELQHGKDPKMRKLAEWIIQGQMTEIGQMKSWLRGRDNPDAPSRMTPEVTAYKEAMTKMHKAMHINYSGNADVDFARGMIPHHQGAIDMAQVELRSGKNQEIHKLAGGIVNAQQAEISAMEHWLAEHAPAQPAKKSKKNKTSHH